MSKSDLEFRIDGPDAERLAGELSDLFEAEFGRRPVPVAAPEGDVATKGPDPWAVAAVIMGIPGTILTTMQLADRVKLKQKWGRLSAWAKKKLADEAGNRITAVSPSGRAVRLEDADPAKLMEMANEMID